MLSQQLYGNPVIHLSVFLLIAHSLNIVMVVKTSSGKISYLISPDHQHSKMAVFISLRATLKDTLMANNIADALRIPKSR